MAGILRQAQKIKKEMEAVQEDLARREVEASAGGGMVTVRVNGRRELLSVRIDPAVINSDDREMLEDLVVAAVNEGLRRAEEMFKEEMAKLTGGLPLPGLLP
ncbi:MAG: YbaB/EbfC family nucleoid-associated protein [Planctomycetota bacterium]